MIVGAQRKIDFVTEGRGRAVRFVIYWKPLTESSAQPVKVRTVQSDRLTGLCGAGQSGSVRERCSAGHLKCNRHDAKTSSILHA